MKALADIKYNKIRDVIEPITGQPIEKLSKKDQGRVIYKYMLIMEKARRDYEMIMKRAAEQAAKDKAGAAEKEDGAKTEAKSL